MLLVSFFNNCTNTCFVLCWPCSWEASEKKMCWSIYICPVCVTMEQVLSGKSFETSLKIIWETGGGNSCQVWGRSFSFENVKSLAVKKDYKDMFCMYYFSMHSNIFLMECVRKWTPMITLIWSWENGVLVPFSLLWPQWVLHKHNLLSRLFPPWF